MICGFHVTISCYGHWLPNDPRGSGSRFVGSEELFHRGGPATKTNSRVSVAHEPHDVESRLRTKERLKYPPVLLTPAQIETVKNVIHLAGTPALLPETPLITCAVALDHTHILFGPTPIDIDEVVMQIKEETVKALLEKGIHPRSESHPEPRHAPTSVWSRGCWKVFIDTPEHLEKTKHYIERHLTR